MLLKITQRPRLPCFLEELVAYDVMVTKPWKHERRPNRILQYEAHQAVEVKKKLLD